MASAVDPLVEGVAVVLNNLAQVVVVGGGEGSQGFCAPRLAW